MKEFIVEGYDTKSRILVGESILNIKNYIDPLKTIIITDTNLNKLYKKQFPECPKVVIGTGESIKTMETVDMLLGALNESELDRTDFVLAIGGGIVCDIAGFVASIYLRGIQFGFVSTSLLSQVDASTGGKNGVNYEGYKNMVGTFNQPEFVICDPKMLETLPGEEVNNGFGEIVKHALIGDSELFEYLEENHSKLLELKDDVINRVVFDSVKLKSAIVSADEKEKGERRKLNFGHTFGHAIEKVTGIKHGNAVSLGMVTAAKMSAEKGMITEETVQRIIKLLESLKLPVSLTGIDADRDALKEAMRKDKKREGGLIKFILLEDIGKAIVEDIDLTDLDKIIDTL